MKRKAVCGGIAVLLFAGIYLAYDRVWPWIRPETVAEKDAFRKLAFESLSERMPKGKPIPPGKPLNLEAKQRLESFDEILSGNQKRRAALLKEFHEKMRRFFVESPGAGSGRDFRITPEMELMNEWGRTTPDQPGPMANFPLSPGEPVNSVEPGKEFQEHHKSNVWAFLNPFGFGYVKSLTQVAGFQSHGFRFIGSGNDDEDRWRVEHIQLIGVLSHDQPIVYLTDKMPSMDQIRLGRTRPLDFFEEAGLPRLRDGDDLFIVSKENTIRMLGALRATKTCQQCHDAQVGDMLGAFSYTLRAVSEPKVERKQGE